MTLSGKASGAGGSDRTALQWKHLRQSADRYDAAARRFHLLPGLLPAALYQRALQLRSLLRGHMLHACERYDVLVSQQQALEEIRHFSFSTAAPFAGIPAISIPCGFTRDALPIGLQIMAKRFDEASIFRAAHAYEQDTPWHTMRPPVGNP